MGHRPNLQDLKDVHPAIFHSLQKLLAQDNAAQLGLVFQVMSSQKSSLVGGGLLMKYSVHVGVLTCSANTMQLMPNLPHGQGM